ncbi:hypothetical protein SLA2020_249820 [Shorea laevis]
MNHLPKCLYTVLFRHFSSLPRTPILTNIPVKYRPQAIKQAQQALTDYFHSTRSMPYICAEHIAKNSIFSLSNLIGKIDYSATNFTRSISRLLRYHPLNEFEFFFESIGIDHKDVPEFLPSNKFFFSEDGSVLDAAGELSGFGFPWNKLGKLYKQEVSIFSKSSGELRSRLYRFKDFGFSNAAVVGICLAFPHVLCGDNELGGEVRSLFDELKRVFVDSDLGSSIEANVDTCYDICRKIRMFCDWGCDMGKVVELMARTKDIFLEYPDEALVHKVEYFCRFCVRKEDAALLILQSPEILSYDLETPVISVMGLLKHFGLNEKDRNVVAQKYPYVFGRNKMVNLPHVVRALNLHEWFYGVIKNGNHQLLGDYSLSNPDEDLDKEFIHGLERIKSSRCPLHTMNKLSFLHRIGYGENALTMNVLGRLHGTSSELQDRFNCLLRCGIKLSNLCLMLKTTPKILNQSPATIEQKVDFLLNEMETSLDYLDTFPGFLCFELENRIKPRYRFHKWLTEKGVCTKNYSIASIVATSEKSYLARLYGIHPTAPKQWFEFWYRKSSNSF